MSTSDLTVDPISEALAGCRIDCVVSGSIGAVESVRFIRSLRRLGAEVVPWLTKGGAQFVTETALSWAAAAPTRREFSGDASHIATNDAVIVAPASASLIGRIARGFTNTPAAALVTSYLGEKRPVLFLPNMHASLADAPAVRENLQTLASFGAVEVPARLEEGKRKFPDPETLADFVAHEINRRRRPGRKVLVTMGTTRGYIDDVRYVSNYSSGGLGSLLSEELYRLGMETHVVLGPCPIRPRIATEILPVSTTDEMQAACAKVVAKGAGAAILAASVLDYTPKTKTTGKIRSGEKALTVEMVPTPKIIASVTPAQGIKVGFKLETGLTEERALEIAREYMERYDLSLMVLNDLADVDSLRHAAWFVEGQIGGGQTLFRHGSKRDVAKAVAAHVERRFGQGAG